MSDSANKCSKCDAHCCRHVALAIDTPRTKKDYDHIRWYLLHENVWISISHNKEWLLEFRTPCKNITKDFRCADYDNRPSICRDYPLPNELCEKETSDLSYKHLFTNAEEFDAFLENNRKRLQHQRVQRVRVPQLTSLG